MTPDMQETDSRAFSHHGYDEQNQEVYLTFRKSGDTWIYPMPKEKYDKMAGDESMGGFFHASVDKSKGRRA
jgi:hypothetical protein